MQTGIHLKVPMSIKMLSDKVQVPKYASEKAACCDLQSTINCILVPGQTALIPLGFAIEVPDGFEFVIRPRSGMSLKTGLSVRNSPGTIDSDYRGEVGLIAKNIGGDNLVIKAGDRVCQGGVRPIFQADFKVVEELGETERGEGGFGSTGTKAL